MADGRMTADICTMTGVCDSPVTAVKTVKLVKTVQVLTLARTGGGVGATPPLRFFADSEKTAARSAAGFWATLWGKPSAIFGKKI